MNKTLLIGLMTSSLLFTACTEEQVTSSIIGIGIGVGIAAIADDNDHHDRRDRDHWDRGDRRGPGYGRGGRGGRGHGYRSFIAGNEADVAAAANVANFAEKFQISKEASAKIQYAFLAAETDGVTSFEAIGLTSSDLKQIAKKNLPSSESLKAMSAKLSLSEGQSAELVKAMIGEFSKQAADIESPYWQSCMASGKWRTAQNNYCSNTAWAGCAPETGATACY